MTTITTAMIQELTQQLRQHRVECAICKNELHFAATSGILADPPVVLCDVAVEILLHQLAIHLHQLAIAKQRDDYARIFGI